MCYVVSIKLLDGSNFVLDCVNTTVRWVYKNVCVDVGVDGCKKMEDDLKKKEENDLKKEKGKKRKTT